MGWGGEDVAWTADVVGDETPKGKVVEDFLWTHGDALAGEADPDEGAGECDNSSDRVEVVDGNAEFLNFVIVRALLGKLKDSSSNSCV